MEEKVPPYTSLCRYWLRTCWVVQLWRNSVLPDVYSSLPLPQQSSWLCLDGIYSINWEASEVQQEVQSSIDFLLKECGFKKGCKSNICGCRKKQSFCSPGCLFQGCTNIQGYQVNENDDDNDDDDDDDGDSTTTGELKSDSG